MFSFPLCCIMYGYYWKKLRINQFCEFMVKGIHGEFPWPGWTNLRFWNMFFLTILFVHGVTLEQNLCLLVPDQLSNFWNLTQYSFCSPSSECQPDLQIAINRQKRKHNQEHLEWTYTWYCAVVKLLTPVYQHNWSRGTVKNKFPKHGHLCSVWGTTLQNSKLLNKPNEADKYQPEATEQQRRSMVSWATAMLYAGQVAWAHLGITFSSL